MNRINDSLGCFYLEEILFTKNYRKDDKRYAFSAQVKPIQPTQIKFVAGLWQDYIKWKELYKKYNFNLLIINKLKLYLDEIY